MDRYAIVKDGKIINIQLWNGDTELWTPPADVEAVLDNGSAFVGGTYVDGVFLMPQPVAPIPSSVTPAQGRIALLRAGLLANVKALVAIAGEDSELGIWWDFATVWERQNSNVLAFAAQLGLTSDQVDQLFIEAATIS